MSTDLPDSLYPEGYRDPEWDGSEAQFRDVVLPARTEAIERTLNEALDLPGGMRFEFGGGSEAPVIEWPDGDWDDVEVTVVSETGWVEARRAVERDVCAAFGVKPWQVGTAPVPWRVRVWRRVSFARWRVARKRARDADPDFLRGSMAESALGTR